MSYIPARVMHRAAPAAVRAEPAPPERRGGALRRLAERVSPKAWTAVAMAASAVAAGVAASVVMDAAGKE